MQMNLSSADILPLYLKLCKGWNKTVTPSVFLVLIWQPQCDFPQVYMSIAFFFFQGCINIHKCFINCTYWKNAMKLESRSETNMIFKLLFFCQCSRCPSI